MTTTIKIPSGLPAFILPDTQNITENRNRSRAGGTKLLAPWMVWVRGPLKKLPPGYRQVWPSNIGGPAVALYGAFDFTADVAPRYVLAEVPHDWAPLPLREVQAWLEPQHGITIQTTQGETQ